MRRALVATAAILLGATRVQAQQAEGDASYPTASAGEVMSVAPSERYAAGGLHRFLFGAHYRDLWGTTVQVPVLSLDTFAGGLTPSERGGGQQTRSLQLEAEDGREFAFRSLDKDPTGAVPEPYRGTVAHRLVQDATSAINPGGALVVPVLLKAAGVLHAPPRLVIMPDDPRLGEYRADFAGLLGMIEERPKEGFAGSDDVADTKELFEHLRETPAHQVDAPGFLAARLVDQLIGDWDRHQDQWRWAGYEKGGRTIWRPIPRDRDQAFARYDGLLTGLARSAHPKLVVFGPDYPANLAGFTWNGRELDRALLSSLDRADFDSVAVALQAALTDQVLDDALARLPAAWHDRAGPALREGLHRRRDGLREHAARYYRHLAMDVDVWGTDGEEAATAHWEDGSLLLQVRSGAGAEPWFERRFVAGETEEVRLHLRGGDDRVELTGGRDGPRLIIVREPDDSILGAGQRGRIGELDFIPEPPGNDTLSVLPEMPRDWGADFSVGPRAGYDPDLGLLVGGGAGRTRYGYRHEPYRSRVRLSGAYATAADGIRAELDADLRRTDHRTSVGLLVRASQIEVVRFNGLGNETRDLGEAGEITHWTLTVAPALERRLTPSVRARAGPVLTWGDSQERLGVRGANQFGRIGATGELRLETPRSSGTLGTSLYPPLWSAAGTYGELHGELRAALPLGTPTLAARVGARRVWGPYPFDDAAFLGGSRTLRGYDYQRFAGDGMMYGGLELRVPTVRLFPGSVPTRVGLIALGDAGRVWADGTSSDRIHASVGAGVWLEFFEPRNAVSVVYAKGGEDGRWYFQLGLPY